jgi:hypothetical protein
MTDNILLPSEAIDALRDGLRGQIATSAQEVTYADELAGGSEDPKRYLEPLQCIDASRALLEEIGWNGQSGDLHVDLRVHRCALLLALQDQIGVNTDLLRDIDQDDERHEIAARSMSTLTAFALILLLKTQVQILRAMQRQAHSRDEAYAGPFL